MRHGSLDRVRRLATGLALCAALASAVTTRAAAQEAAPRGLDAVVERLDLRDVPLRDALRLLAEESGVNLVCSQKAGELAVSCFLQDASLRSAIESLAKSYDLWYREDEALGGARVMTTEEYRRDLTLFRDEETRVLTLLYPNALEISLAIRNLFGSRVRLSLDRETRYEEFSDINQRFQRFDILDRRTQGRSQFGGFGNGGGGLGASGVRGYTNQGLLGGGFQNLGGTFGGAFSNPAGYGADGTPPTDRVDVPELTPDQVARLEEALRTTGQLDEELLARLSGEQATIYVSILRKSNQIAVRSGDAHALEEIEELVRALDVPTPQVLLEIKILNLDLGDEFQSAFDLEYGDLGSTEDVARSGVGSIVDGTGGIDPGGLLYSRIDGRFRARLQLLQERRRINTLATPLLLVANNEVARLFIGEERPVVRNISSQTTVNSNVSTTTPNTSTELRPVGTTLLLTPNVNADRTVTLRVLQETSEVVPDGASIPVVTGNGGVVDQPIDTVASRTITGTVVAKDGLALALGGLIEERLVDRQAGVPLLMDLPLVGALFRRETKERVRRELVVLIRPRVLFTADEGRAWSRELSTRLSFQPGAEDLDAGLGTFLREETPRPPLGRQPVRETFLYQSGLPDGE